MRTLPQLSAVCLLAACQSTPSVPANPMRGAFVDANYARGPAPAGPQVLAPDTVVAEVLRGAMQTFATRRRVAIENLANAATPAYKQHSVEVSTQTVAAADGTTLEMPVVVDLRRDFRQGALQVTERSLDVAIDGEGFFEFGLPDGSTGYRRDGSFALNADGKVVFANGHTLQTNGGTGEVLLPEITVPCDTLEISIDPEGRFTGRTAGSPDTRTTFGQITLHRFVHPAGLRCIDGHYRVTDRSGHPITGTPGLHGLGLLKQGCRELSNVDSANAIMELQELERQHEWLVRVLERFGMIAP